MNILKSSFWEIDRSPSLQNLGVILSFIHFLNYFFWKAHAQFLTAEIAKPVLCWEFFENCTKHGASIASLSHQIFTAYAIFAALAFFLFIWKRFVRLSWTFLFLASLIHLILYITDASLRSDIHGLLIFINLGFLLIPSKTSLVRISIILFYILSAYRELSPEWLSGAGLIESMNLPYKGLEWIAAMGVALRLTLPLLLISPIGQRLALGASGLLFFHGFYFYFLKDFTSITMILFIVFFILDFYMRKKQERETLYQSYAHPEPSKLWWPAAALFYLMAQTAFLPTTWLSEIIRVTGPVVSSECHHISFANFTNHVEQIENAIPEKLDQSVKCHPLVAFNSAKEICEKYKGSSEFKSLSTFFVSRRLTENSYRTTFAVENICAPNIKYSDSVTSR